VTWVESRLTSTEVEKMKSKVEKMIVRMNDTAAGINTESMDAPPPLPW